MKKIAILQSNYIPWKGYFDLLAAVDECIIFDDAQYTRQDWRNRNLIKTPQGVRWLTVPVKSRGRSQQKIRQAEINGGGWASKHWKTLVQNYRHAPHFSEIADWLEPLYLRTSYSHLSTLNRQLIAAVCQYLGIRTLLTDSCNYRLREGRSQRLADLCLQAGGTEYVTGPRARHYLDPHVFTTAGITLRWFDYAGYPQYPQLWGDFAHEVSVLDLLFNCGKAAPGYMRHVGA